MDFLFGRRKTPAELLRQNQRALNKAMRELDRYNFLFSPFSGPFSFRSVIIT